MEKFDKNQKKYTPVFINGDCFDVLKRMEKASIDCVITSPPYFREREKNKHFNLNQSLDSYIKNILDFSRLVKIVLKECGSFWLNLGDSFSKCSLQLIPYKIADSLIQDGWILNNDVIWHKTSSTPTSYSKRLTLSHEHFFHFVLNKNFYYNITSLESKRNSRKVSLSNLFKRINESELSEVEKENAKEAVRNAINELNEEKIKDFRLVLKGKNQVFSKHRIDELNRNGFYLIKSKNNKTTDVWDINTEKRAIITQHFQKSLLLYL